MASLSREPITERAFAYGDVTQRLSHFLAAREPGSFELRLRFGRFATAYALCGSLTRVVLRNPSEHRNKMLSGFMN
ncbi:hypothetical protein EHO57_00350 [Leptospira langatensis]|uniref:Uncharacterized protein n=1 Tax=Leptospira langatensis TaxID=2484983 RepID=A0A5R2AZ56_9LEPT|nr:hypothetical protein EHO57_00350 [Leptospira langatensis]